MGLDMYLYARLEGTGDVLRAAGVDTSPADPDHPDVPRFLHGLDYEPGACEQRDLGVAALGAHGLVCRVHPTMFVYPDAVEVTSVYWRKANAVHRWFVENCQGGVDDCNPSGPVHVEQLAALVHLCEQVLKDPTLAPELLPTCSGFFFGDTAYDEWYLGDLHQTVTDVRGLVTRAVQDFPGRLTFLYQSSW